MTRLKARKGMPSTTLDKAEFERRLRRRHYDPAFAPLDDDIEKILAIA